MNTGTVWGTRRSNGEGALYRTRDRRWRGQASLAGQRPGVSGRTRAEAARKLRQLLAAHRAAPGPAVGTTLGEVLARWREEEVRPTRKPRTHRLYCDLARLHVWWLVGTTVGAAEGKSRCAAFCAVILAQPMAARAVLIMVEPGAGSRRRRTSHVRPGR